MALERNEIKLFENKEIRRVWDSGIDGYYISVIDIIAAITESKHQSTYWGKLKSRLSEESGQPFPKWERLKMPAKDGKMRETDVATVKQMLRIIQSIPSPKAEPIKQWLAQLGQERLDEMADPEQAIERAIDYYRKKGHSEEWISQRLRSIEIRKDLTSEWDRSGVQQGQEYTMLTNEVSKTWSGMTTREYKDYKGLRKESLRDNMTNTELVLNMLAEVSTTEISRAESPQGFEESKDVAQRGGNIAGSARENLEKQLGKKVISKNNSKNPRLLDE
ncbi:MAG: hypothetical protein Q4P18_08400 [Methanobrevibacter sp.]|uniref:hypothetical protein n=1 Tax=Methanobrevibacter sp. TaxID=66852 RepID=UPI0026E10F9E|nr:hypothetical protein [Methanobrevibacter sp.]MDO5849543.1 hypothetical protein [Methanobrevibacter sp.]